VCLGVGGFFGQRSAIILYRFVGFALKTKGIACVVEVNCVIRLGTEGLVEVAHCLVEFALFRQCDSKLVVDLWAVGVFA